MKSAERQAVINQKVAISNIESIHRDRKLLPEIFSESEIDLCMSGQVRAGKLRVGRTIGKTRAVINVRRDVIFATVKPCRNPH